MLHEEVPVADPGQSVFLPLEQDLLLFAEPPPHVRVHADQGLHGLQAVACRDDYF